MHFSIYCHVSGGTRDKNDGFQFEWLDLLAPWLHVLLITLKCSAIAQDYCFFLDFSIVRYSRD
jgi:hypothetical protein